MRIELIKELRDRTNVGLGLCNKALQEAGNVEGAIVLLQKWGELRMAHDKDTTKVGLLNSFTHHNGKISCMVEVNCESEEKANSVQFKDFCEVVALQIIAMAPKYLCTDQIPAEVLEKQREIFSAQLPDKVPPGKIEHIINGKMRRWFSEVCLMDQKSVATDSGKTIEQLRQDLVSELDQNIIVKRFIRWELGKHNES